MSKAKAKTTTKPIEQASPAEKDAVLVTACVRYVQEYQAAVSAFKADPHPNSETAEVHSRKHYRSADKLLDMIGPMKAATVMGIAAKARIATTVIDADDGNLEERSIKYFSQFSEDVSAFTSLILEAEWKAERAAAKGGEA